MLSVADVPSPPDSMKETYHHENDKKMYIQHTAGEQQKVDIMLEEQFKKYLAQLEKGPFSVIHEGNNQASERKESFSVNNDRILNSLSNDNVQGACTKDNIQMSACKKGVSSSSDNKQTEAYTKDVKLDRSTDNIEDCDPRDSRKFRYQSTLNFDNDEVESIFKFLSDMTSSEISKFHFRQSTKMLSMLNNNLKRLESLISGSFEDEFSSKIKRQRYRVTNLLIKVIKNGISRAVEKLAWHIYDKVRKVEQSIQNQWCKFESKIVALDRDTNIPFEKCSRKKNDNQETRKVRAEKTWNERLNMKNEYQVDKDSVGKDCSKHSVKEGDVYKNIMKNKEHNQNRKCDTGFNKYKYGNNKMKHSNLDREPTKKDSSKEENKKSKRERKHSRKGRKYDRINKEMESEKLNGKFKRENGVNINQWKNSFSKGKIENNKFIYDKVKSEHACSHNGKTVQCTANFVKENVRKPAQQQSGKIEYEIVKQSDELLTDRNKNLYHTETKTTHFGSDKTIKGIKQWSFVINESDIGNSSGVSGDWFIKSGEARSKIRNSNHKSDWLFERAKGRQVTRQDYYSSAMWVFRRAYARHQCRLSPNLPWCQWQKQTIKTFPTSSYFR